MWFGRFFNSWKWGICFVIFAINQLQTFQDYLRGPYRQSGPHHRFECKKANNWTYLAISRYCGSSKVFQLVLSHHPLFQLNFEPKMGPCSNFAPYVINIWHKNNTTMALCHFLGWCVLVRFNFSQNLPQNCFLGCQKS